MASATQIVDVCMPTVAQYTGNRRSTPKCKSDYQYFAKCLSLFECSSVMYGKRRLVHLINPS